MSGPLNKDERRHVETLGTRLSFLRQRIHAKGRGSVSTYDLAEAKALEWVIGEVSKVRGLAAEADVQLVGEDGLYRLSPLSDAGRAWMAKQLVSVDFQRGPDGTIVFEGGRVVADIAETMRSAGLRVSRTRDPGREVRAKLRTDVESKNRSICGKRRKEGLTMNLSIIANLIGCVVAVVVFVRVERANRAQHRAEVAQEATEAAEVAEEQFADEPAIETTGEPVAAVDGDDQADEQGVPDAEALVNVRVPLGVTIH